MPAPRIALQLYTIRDALQQDFAATLHRVREIGYSHVEMAGFGTHTAVEVKAMLDDAGLTPTSSHCPIDRLENDIDAALDDIRTLGVKYIICPWLPEERRKDEAAWRGCARSLAKAGAAARSRGITLCYHNHSFEFVKVGGRYALDLLYDETDPTHVQAELDTYWIRHGGADPAAYIRKLANRCPVLHIKDMADNPERSFAEVGNGILDWKGIFAAASDSGVEWAIVEQDTCPGDPFESIRLSLENLRRMGYAPRG